MFAHGGMFRTAGVAQRLLAAAIGAPVTVGDTASEGGAWGIAVLAEYLRTGAGEPLGEYLADRVFASADLDVAEPDPVDVEGYAKWLTQYTAGLAIMKAATEAIR
jgi:sugar (pentulose or hexulose) kinase